MPVISRFEGIQITMNWNDHNPPHFHAAYGKYEVTVDIRRCVVLSGSLPRKKLMLVLAWCALCHEELIQNWELSRDHKPLENIPPLTKGGNA